MNSKNYTVGRQTGRIAYLSLLAIISAVSVVTLHANGCFWNFSQSRYWITANVIECVFYFAVPVFFMISGAALLDFPERYGLKTYFKKRITKTVIPFFVWSLIALGFRVFFLKDLVLEKITVTTLWNLIVTTKIIGIYWFFIPLFCIYLCVPLFVVIPQEKKKEIFIYITCCGLILNTVIPFVLRVFHSQKAFPFHVDVVSGYLLYILLGYLITHVDFSRRVRYFVYACGFAGLLAHILGTYILSWEAGKIIDTFKGYNNLPCVFYSLAVFLLVKECAEKMPRCIERLVNFLDKYTFSIYILHWFVMQSLVHIFHLNTYSIFYRLGGPIPIIAICMGITVLFWKIGGRRILP